MEYNPWILLAESAPIGVKAPGRTDRCDHDDMFLVRAAAMGRGVGSLAYLFLGWRRPLNSVARNIVRGRRGRGQLRPRAVSRIYGFYAGRDRNARERDL